MPDRGRPRLRAASESSLLLLASGANDQRPVVHGPHLSLRAPASDGDATPGPPCPADRLQLRWTLNTSGEGAGPQEVAIDPPTTIGQAVAGSWRLHVPLEPLLLQAHARGRGLQLAIDQPLQLTGLAAPPGLRQTLAALCHSSLQGHSSSWLLLETQLLDQLLQLLTQPQRRPGGSERLVRQDRGWQHVLLSLERMQCNLHEPLSLQDLSSATGVSPRALQMAYRRHLDKRPLQSLRELRLARLRRLLLLGQRQSRSLVEVLEDCGLPGNGITARYYQERYGEKPSQTRG
jgi:AraC-like DNA-binding protein